MKEHEIPDYNVFMVCNKPDPEAFRELPSGLKTRILRREELPFWKGMIFDTPEDRETYRPFMDEWYDRVYLPREDLFFQKALVVCNAEDQPIGTCFIWKAYGEFNTIHWYKVSKAYEGQGIGRALLTEVMRGLDLGEYPVYLHTQPGSFRAIKLYSDFGFDLLTDPVIGHRKNELEETLPILQAWMPAGEFAKLRITQASPSFLQTVANYSTEEF